MKIVFTHHARDRMKKRKITEEEVAETLKFPDKTSKKESKYYAQKNIKRAKIEVAYERDKYLKVITVYYI